MESEIWKYIASLKLFHRMKAPHHACYVLNMPLSAPSRPWEGLTMHFVTDLHESTASGYTGIFVIVDHLNNMVIYLPCRLDIDSPQLARMIFENVICKQSVTDNIPSDRGKKFTSRFWDRVCSHLTMNDCLSTGSHPQTDGQTEW